jgi:hypothetical protein
MLEEKLLREQGANQYTINPVCHLPDVPHAVPKFFELYFLVFA